MSAGRTGVGAFWYPYGDGNLTRAALALDAAPRQALVSALARVIVLFSATGDEELWRSFEASCDGTLGSRLGDRLRTFTEKKERTVLRETLREWDEQNRQEGLQEGLREVKRTLCSPARQRFGEAAGAALSGILTSVDDSAELARVGTLIIGCDTEAHSSLACGRASGRVGSGSGWAVRDQELWHAEARMDEQAKVAAFRGREGCLWWRGRSSRKATAGGGRCTRQG